MKKKWKRRYKEERIGEVKGKRGKDRKGKEEIGRKRKRGKKVEKEIR